MSWNLSTGAVVGMLVGGLGYALTGLHHMSGDPVTKDDVEKVEAGEARARSGS